MAEETVRISVRYSARSARILGLDVYPGRAPASDFRPTPLSQGAWITIHDAAGKETYHRPIHGAPDCGHDGDSRQRRSEVAIVEAPWPGDGAKVSVHVRRPRHPARGAALETGIEGAPSRVALLSLRRPREPAFATEAAPAYPFRVETGWGETNPNAITLIFAADGFRAGRMGGFHKAVDRFLAHLPDVKPFEGLKGALRIVRAETPSRQEGVITDKEKGPRDTFFGGWFRYGFEGRVIDFNPGAATPVLRQFAPKGPGAVLIVANTQIYGGSGGKEAAVFSCHETWGPDIGLHELCHTLFDLADEYGVGDPTRYGPPTEANVDDGKALPNVKWKKHIKPGTPMPPAGQTPPDRIGAFMGAKYSPDRVRPALVCKMRDLQTPQFCEVCQEAIAAAFAPRH